MRSKNMRRKELKGVERRARADFAIRKTRETVEERAKSEQIGPSGSESGQIEEKPEWPTYEQIGIVSGSYGL